MKEFKINEELKKACINLLSVIKLSPIDGSENLIRVIGSLNSLEEIKEEENAKEKK